MAYASAAGEAWKATGSDSGAWLAAAAAAVVEGSHWGTAGSHLPVEEECGEVVAAAAVVAAVAGVAAVVEYRVKTTTVAEREMD